MRTVEDVLEEIVQRTSEMIDIAGSADADRLDGLADQREGLIRELDLSMRESLQAIGSTPHGDSRRQLLVRQIRELGNTLVGRLESRKSHLLRMMDAGNSGRAYHAYTQMEQR